MELDPAAWFQTFRDAVRWASAETGLPLGWILGGSLLLVVTYKFAELFYGGKK